MVTSMPIINISGKGIILKHMSCIHYFIQFYNNEI